VHELIARLRQEVHICFRSVQGTIESCDVGLLGEDGLLVSEVSRNLGRCSKTFIGPMGIRLRQIIRSLGEKLTDGPLEKPDYSYPRVS
jgi:hypothetical protein